MTVAYAFHWWVAVLIVVAVPVLVYVLLALAIWLSGRSWKSDS